MTTRDTANYEECIVARRRDVEYYYGDYHAGYSSMRLAGVVEVAEKDMDSKCILV